MRPPRFVRWFGIAVLCSAALPGCVRLPPDLLRELEAVPGAVPAAEVGAVAKHGERGAP